MSALLLTLPAMVYPADTPDIHALYNKAKALHLDRHPTWHKLLLYENNDSLPSEYKSAIHSSTFFNSPNGNSNPEHELIATLQAFTKAVGENPNTHAQCKFRGRYVWLDHQLNFAESGLRIIDCPDYQDWSLNGTTESVSVVFATGYLGNPASYYGHTLLKMNSSRESSSTKLEDITVNYGAIIPPGEGPIPYILKGLFGGYEAGFSHIQYYFHNHNYGENELRDLWEYELNLNPKELDLVLGHAWEVLSEKYTYFFTKKNCAYRMAELLEVVKGIDITPTNPLWCVPQSLIQKIAGAQHNGRPLVKKIKYHPSRQSRLYKRYARLNSEQRSVLEKIVDDINLLESSHFALLEVESRQLILDTLLDYYQYVRDSAQLEKDQQNIAYRKVLAKRYQLPPGGEVVETSLENSPHKGRKPSMVSLGAIHNSEFNNGISVLLRPVYYDALDADFGHINNASLSMGETRLTLFDNKLKLRSLDIFKVESVSNAVTGLPGDTGQSWKLGLGLERQSLACDNCLVAYFQGDIGHTLLLDDKFMIGGYLGGSIQQDKNNLGSAYARASGFLNANLGDNCRIRLTTEYREYLDSKSSGDFVHGIHARYRLATNFDLRVSYQKNIAKEISASLVMYW